MKSFNLLRPQPDTTFKRLLAGRPVSTRDLARLIATPDGVLGLAALHRAHLDHEAETAALKHRPSRGKRRVRERALGGRKSLKRSLPQRA